MKKLLLISVLGFFAMNLSFASTSVNAVFSPTIEIEDEKDKKKCKKNCKDGEKKCCSDKASSAEGVENTETTAAPTKSCGNKEKKACCSAKK